MGTYINPFDFKTIFLEYFLGSTELFIYAFIILIGGVCAKFQIPTKVFTMLLIISSLIFASFIGQPIFIIALLIVGFISFKSFSRILT